MRRRSSALFLIGFLGLLACTVRWTATYDEHIDQAATELQIRMDAYLTRLENTGPGEGLFEDSRGFYDDYAVGIRSVRIRAQAHEQNDITLQQLDRMLASLQELRRQHQEADRLSPAYVRTVRELFNTGWAAVIAWEVAKKRGQE